MFAPIQLDLFNSVECLTRNGQPPVGYCDDNEVVTMDALLEAEYQDIFDICIVNDLNEVEEDFILNQIEDLERSQL